MKLRILVIINVCSFYLASAQVSFTTIDGPPGGNVSKIVTSSTGELFALTGTTLFKSSDAAATWNQLPAFPTNTGPVDVYVDNNDKIYVLNKDGVASSTDGGATWNQIDATGTFEFPQKILKNETTGTLFIIGWTGSNYGLAKSIDDGATWTGSYTSTQVNDFTIKNTGTFSHIYIATNSGTSKIQKNTNDGGPLNWSDANTGTPSATPVSLGVNKFNGNIYAIFYGSGTYLTTNNATSWSLVAGVPGTINYGDSNGDWDLFASVNSNRWFIVYDEDKNSNGSTKRVYTASIANPTIAGDWLELTTLAPTTPVRGIISFGSDIVVGMLGEGILKSFDTGSSWASGDNGLNQANTTGLILASDTELLTAHGTSRVTRSFDNNSTPTFSVWSKPLTAGNMTSFVELSDGKILAVGSQTYVSANNGQSYSVKGTTPGTITLYKAHRFSDTEIYAIGSQASCCPVVNNIYKTTNQGTTWNILSLTGLPATRQIVSLSTTSNGDLYIGLIDNTTTSTNRIYRVPTGSTVASLLSVPGFTQYAGISAVGFKVYVLGSGGSGAQLAISSNSGANWATKSSQIYESLFAVRDGLIFGSNYSDVVYSNDEGDTWNTIGAIPSGGDFIGVALNSEFKAIVGVSKGPFYMSSQPVVRPNQPQNLRSIGTSSSLVHLQWEYTGPPEPANFIIERKEVSESNFTVLNQLGSSTVYYKDQNATPNTNYTYRVKAQSLAGFQYSAELNVTTTTNTCSNNAIPDNRSWTGTVAGSPVNAAINIRKIGEDLYSISDVAANSLSGSPFFLPSPISGTFYENCGQPFLDDDNDIYPNGNGTWNGTNTITLNWHYSVYQPNTTAKVVTLTLNPPASEPAPAVPTGVKAYASSNTTATIEWSAGNYQHQYIVERATNAAFTTGLTIINPTVDYPTTSITDNGPLTPGITYFYRVKAENIDNDVSAYSTTASLVFAVPNFISSNTLVSSTTANTLSVSWADLDNDDDDDLIIPEYGAFSSSEKEPLFFKNDGLGNFSLQTGTGVQGAYVLSVSGDYNNNGTSDILFNGFGSFLNTSIPKKNSLLTNTGAFTFNDASSIPFSTPTSFSLSSSWVDVNNDGNLDLFIGYLAGPKLYLGDGVGGFTEVTTDPLVTDVYETNLALWGDYDNDVDQDAFIIDDNGVNRLYENDGAGNFTYVTGTAFDIDNTQTFSSAAWGDYDNDGDLDLFTTVSEVEISPGVYGFGANILYRNNGNKTFTKLPVVANSPTENKTAASYACAWSDIDNDADLDLVVANSVSDDGLTKGYGVIYLNQGSGVFAKSQPEYFTSGMNFYLPFAAAFADYNNDGFQDFVTSDIAFSEGSVLDAPQIKLLKNNRTSGNYLKVKLTGTISNVSAIGARVIVTANGKTQIREVQSLSGVAAQNSQTLHFGLGTATSVTSITVKWPSGIVQTIENEGVNKTTKVTEDGTGPVGSVFSPANNATGVSSTTKITLTLNETSTAVAGKLLMVYLNSNLSAPITGIDVTTAVKTGNTYEFTITPKLQASTQYNISIDAGAFLDIYGNPSLEFPTGLWTFTTGAGPVISTLSPVHNTNNIAVNAPIEITFDKTITAVAGKKIKVMDGATALVDLDVSTNGTLSSTGALTNNKYTLPAPAANWPFNKQLSVVVDPGAFVNNGNDFAGIPDGSWTFVTAEAPDVTPPVISFTAITTPDKGFVTGTPSIGTVTDNKAVTAVVVSIRKISGTTYTQVNATPGAANGYTVALTEASHFDETGAEFFITATDAAGNSTREPAGTATHKVYLKYNLAQSAIPSNRLGFGGQKANWKVIAIPFELASPTNSVSAIFNELDGLDSKKDYRIITYGTPTAWSEYPSGFSTIARGMGYFINIKTDPGVIGLFNNLQPPANSRGNLYQITLKPGWNMIGNPYLSAISWADVATLNSLTGTTAQLKKFSLGTYTNNQSLDSYEGGFVFSALTSNKTVDIPFLGQTAPGGRKGFHELGNDISADAWALPMKINQGEFSYDLSAIGMTPEANTSLDDYDDVTPPRFFDYLEMNFSHPEHFAKRFTRDIVQTQQNYTWEFTVDTNIQGYAELTWDNTPISGSTKDLFLMDISGNRLINLKETGSYLFDPKLSSNFRIYFGENLKIAPEQVHLGNAWPNPTNGYTTIAFSLPETGGLNQLVKVDIMDAMGREVGKITEGRYNPGFHETGFDAKEFNNGFYTYRLTVQGIQGSTTQVNKLIIK